MVYCVAVSKVGDIVIVATIVMVSLNALIMFAVTSCHGFIFNSVKQARKFLIRFPRLLLIVKVDKIKAIRNNNREKSNVGQQNKQRGKSETNVP